MPLLMQTQPIWPHLLQQQTIIPLAAMLFGVIVIFIGVWRKVETHKADVELKRDMIARGMSPEDIERVLAARSSDKTRR